LLIVLLDCDGDIYVQKNRKEITSKGHYSAHRLLQHIHRAVSSLCSSVNFPKFFQMLFEARV
jgi:hypothetical protein